MSEKVDKATQIKNFAIEGDFRAIEANFGSKMLEKAKTYVSEKLSVLRESQDVESLQRFVTPFTTFALTFDVSASLDDIVERFYEVDRGSETNSNDIDICTPLEENTITKGQVAFRPQKPKENHVSSVKVQTCKDSKKEIGSGKKISNSSTSKMKKKKEKDPNQPKGAKSAFMFYLSDIREEIKTKNPEFRLTDCTKEAGRLWRELKEEDKEPYVALANQDKLRANNELAEYRNGGKDNFRSDEKTATAVEDRNIICQEDSDDDTVSQENLIKESNRNVNLNEALECEAGNECETGPVEQKISKKASGFKAPVTLQGRQPKTAEIKEKRPKLVNENSKSAERKEKRSKQVKECSFPGLPKKGKSSYMFFLAEVRQEISKESPNQSIAEIAKEAGRRWGELRMDDRQKYVDMANSDKQRAITEMEKFRELHPEFEASKRKTTNLPKSKKRTRESKYEGPKSSSRAPPKVSDDSSSDENTARRVLSRRRRGTSIVSMVTPTCESNPKFSNSPNSSKKLKSKEIRFESMPPEEALVDTVFVPLTKESFPPDYVPSVQEKVAIVMFPYREFLSQFPRDQVHVQLLTSAELICSTTDSVVFGTVLSVDEKSSSEDKIYSLSVQTHNGKYTVLYVPFSSRLLTCDVFLLKRSEYSKSLSEPWMVVGAQVRKHFMAVEAEGIEWHEGNIYYIGNLEANPFRSVLVAWVGLEEGPRTWSYRYLQTDNECSPWELKPSQYVKLENIKEYSLPGSLLVGKINSMLILDYVKSLDFAYVFKFNLRADTNFTDMFPNECDQLDLIILTEWCKQGRYDGNLGIVALFRDLDHMASIGKKYNDSNKSFQPWRLIDMMEKTLVYIKLNLAKKHGLTVLMESVQEDLEEKEKMTRAIVEEI